ncbi:hypothetical protein [Mucilaginibacter sp.]|uniref:hypothetical protein n=1 Tax=Mucilaginibacter sp. TaxID=1882438 RepID=UPI0032659536
MFDLKKLIFITLCTMASFATKAQLSNRVQLSIGPDVGIVTGTLANTHSAMFGGSVQVGFPLNRGL